MKGLIQRVSSRESALRMRWLEELVLERFYSLASRRDSVLKLAPFLEKSCGTEFYDSKGLMNRSLLDISGDLLVVSNLLWLRIPKKG